MIIINLSKDIKLLRRYIIRKINNKYIIQHLIFINIYWRSVDGYKGKDVLSGPATSGFEDLQCMEKAKVKMSYKIRTEEGRRYIDIDLRNVSDKIAFFNQIQVLDVAGSPIRPTFYSDNFFTLLPKSDKKITVELMEKNNNKEISLVLKGWNINKQKVNIK